MEVAQWLEREALPMSLPAAGSNAAWWRILREIPYFSSLEIRTLFRRCVIGQVTLASHASLDSGVSEYLVRLRWQCVR